MTLLYLPAQAASTLTIQLHKLREWAPPNVGGRELHDTHTVSQDIVTLSLACFGFYRLPVNWACRKLTPGDSPLSDFTHTGLLLLPNGSGGNASYLKGFVQ